MKQIEKLYFFKLSKIRFDRKRKENVVWDTFKRTPYNRRKKHLETYNLREKRTIWKLCTMQFN